MQQRIQKQSGFFLIEVVVATALVGTVLIYLLGVAQDTVEIAQRSLERTQSAYLLEEAGEAVKAIRDDSWSTISATPVDTTHYLLWNGAKWTLTTTPSTIDSFTRTITLSTVSRDASDDTTSSGGTVDPRTRKVTVVVTWIASSGVQTQSMSFYIADIRT